MSTKIFLTSGTSWTVPSDWNSSSNTIETIGNGGDGGTTNGGGGGGGAYASISSISLTPGTTVTYQVGTTSVPDTWFHGATFLDSFVGAKGGSNASSHTGGAGGLASASIGDIKFNGGTGGNGNNGNNTSGGGAGAAGLNGIGANGNGGSGTPGGPGGNGGTGDNTHGGAGGAGATLNNTTAVAGGNGTEYDGTHGSGGGGGGGNGGTTIAGANGGNYGGGGGGAGNSSNGVGIQGLIVITYDSIFTSPRFWVGGTANWDASNTANWSLTSGGASGASVPTSANDVVFDFNSTGTATLTTSPTVRGVNVVGFTGGLSLGSNTISLAGTGTVWNMNTTAFTFTPATSTLKLTDTSSTGKTFQGGGLTYHNLWITGSGTGTYTINDSNTFSDFKADTPPHTILFQATKRQTVSTFTVNGTAGNLMTLHSTIPGSQWELASANEIVCQYLSLKDSHGVQLT